MDVKNIDESGSKQTARYVLPGQSCGTEQARRGLREALVDNRGSQLETILSGQEFPHLNAFLETIAQATKMEPYSAETVKAYWLGPEISETVKPIPTDLLAQKYESRVSHEFAQVLRERLPKEIHPTHLTMVAYIASSELSGDMRIAGINYCMISGGRVTKVDEEEKTAVVERDILVRREDDGFEIAQQTATVTIDTDLTPNLKERNLVALHQGCVADMLTQEDFDRLRLWNEKVAKTLEIS